jgi:hypothetical protein
VLVLHHWLVPDEQLVEAWRRAVAHLDRPAAGTGLFVPN